MSEKKLNILFLSSWYPNRVEPNLGNFVQKHAEAVAIRSNVYALHVCSDPSITQDDFEIIEQNINGINTVNVYYKKITGQFPLVSSFIKFVKYIKAHRLGYERLLKKAGHFDLVHHNILWPAGLFARWLKKKHGLQYIITENNTAYLPYRNYKFSWAEKFLSKKISADAAYITPVSVDLQKAMTTLGFNSKYEIVYNVVDTRLFSPSPQVKKQSRALGIAFLHISTLQDEHKNISGILRVIAHLQKERTDFNVLIAGDGDLTPHIAYAKELNIINPVISFKGNQTSIQVAELMRNSDAFILFSNYENLPCVMVEALASGLPVVSSRVGGIPEHINDNNGILVDARDETALLNALKQMLDNLSNGKYNKAALNKYAVEHFSYENVSKRFHDIYSLILNKHVQ